MGATVAGWVDGLGQERVFGVLSCRVLERSQNSFCVCESQTHKAVISLARIRIHKYTKDGFSSLRRKKRFAEMKNRHLCICFVRKVISLDEFTDTHYKMTRSLFVNS